MESSHIIKAEALPYNVVILFKLPRQRYFRKFVTARQIKDTDKVPESMKGKILVHFKNNQDKCGQLILKPEQDIQAVII